MQFSLPLDEMTIHDKLKVMEDLWVDLTKQDNTYTSPEWHNEVLILRAKRVQEGEENYKEWEVAKKELRNNLK
ncbi:MAG TPA: addiction module protein [Ignavibacteriaceae bacterium]|nr:addiction module protein [Ignavibacteriaceae bacterium]